MKFSPEEQSAQGMSGKHDEVKLRTGKNKPIVSPAESEKYDGSDPDNEEFLKTMENKYAKPGPFITVKDIAAPMKEEDDEDEKELFEVERDKFIDQYNKENKDKGKL